MFFFIPITLPTFDIFSMLSASHGVWRAMKENEAQAKAAEQMARANEIRANPLYSKAIPQPNQHKE